MGLFEQFPYTNFHELNMDWIIQQINTVLNSAVISVNGDTGAVVLYKDPSVHFPDIPDQQWNVFRISDGAATGIEFNKNAPAVRIDGVNRYQIYDQNNQPPYPVMSVNGDTGAITLYQNPSVHFPDVAVPSWNVYRISDGAATGIEFTKNAPAVRIDGANRYNIYDAGNPPPYPVTSVDGQTGAVTINFPVTSVDGATGAIIQWFNSGMSKLHLPVASTYTDWSLVRELSNNTELGLRIAYNSLTQTYEAFIAYTEYGGTEQFVRLLTPDDIPSSSGVVSWNGQTGVVVVTGSDIRINNSSYDSIDNVIQTIESDIAIIVNGDSTGQNVTKGQYVFVRESTIAGITDGLYSVKTTKTAGTPFTSADLNLVSIGGLNALLATTYQRQSSITNGTGYVDFTKIGHLVNMLVSITPSDNNTSITFQIPDDIFFSSQNVYDKRNIQGSNIYLYFYQNTPTVTISHTTSADIALTLTFIADH